MSLDLPPWLNPLRDRRTMSASMLAGFEYWSRLKIATPPWCDMREVNRMKRQHRAAGLVSDHVVPLRHSLVCGLHCPDNLQGLTEAQNAAKSNHWWPDCPHECLDLFGVEEVEQYALPLQMQK